MAEYGPSEADFQVPIKVRLLILNNPSDEAISDKEEQRVAMLSREITVFKEKLKPTFGLTRQILQAVISKS